MNIFFKKNYFFNTTEFIHCTNLNCNTAVKQFYALDYTEQDFSETAGGEFKNTLDIGKSPGSSSQGFCFILVQKKKKLSVIPFCFWKECVKL